LHDELVQVVYFHEQLVHPLHGLLYLFVQVELVIEKAVVYVVYFVYENNRGGH
jgi:hypothetical protein